MESLKIFAILLLVALPLASAAGGDSRKRKEVGESSSQRPAKSTRQEAQPQAPSPYPGSEFLQTPQLEYDMPQGYDTDFTALRQGFVPQSPLFPDQAGGSSTHPTMPMSFTPLDHPPATPAEVAGAGAAAGIAAGSSSQPPAIQSADMSSEELFQHWYRSYLTIFRPESPNIEPEQFKSYLTQLKSFEQSAQFHDLYKQAEKSARPQEYEMGVLWDYVKDAKMLMQQRLTLARKFKTLADVLLQLFNWGQNSCIPNDVAKLAQIKEKLTHHESVKKILDFVMINQQHDCDSRYREVILNGEILLGQDTKEAARRMLELTARETIQQMMTNKNDPKLFKKIVDVLSLYLAQLDTAKFENFGVIEIDNPKIEYPKMYENEIINPCARICELNQIPYNYYVEYRAIAQAQGPSGQIPMSEDLDLMIQKIEFCCFVHNKKPPADEVKNLYELKKHEILVHQAQQEAGGAGAQPASGASGAAPTQAGQPTRLQVSLPSELMGSEAARIPARGAALGPEKDLSRPLGGVVIREPGQAQQQRPSDAHPSGRGKAPISNIGAEAIMGQLYQQFGDELDPALQEQLLSAYLSTHQQNQQEILQQQQQQYHVDPHLQAQLMAPFEHVSDLQNPDPAYQAALMARYEHEQQLRQYHEQHNPFYGQPAPHESTQHQQSHPELHQQFDPHAQYDPQSLATLQAEQPQYDPQLLATLQAEQQMYNQYQQQLLAQHQSQPPVLLPPHPQPPHEVPPQHRAEDPQQPRHRSDIDVSDSE